MGGGLVDVAFADEVVDDHPEREDEAESGEGGEMSGAGRGAGFLRDGGYQGT